MKMGFVKSSLLCLGVLLACLAFTNVSDAVTLDNVIAIWTFDEGAGETAGDSSGNGNNADFAVGEPQWVGGKFGGALQFDGAKDGGAFVEVGAPVVVDTVDFTMGCYVNPGDAQNTWTNILSSHQEPPRRGISFEMIENNLNLFGIAIGDGPNWAGNGNVQLDTNAWNHMAFVRRGDKGYWYFNGAPDEFVGPGGEAQLASADPVVAATSNFRIGNWVLGGREFNGIVDDAFLFERALSAEEIADIAANGIAAALAGGTSVDPRDKASVTWGQIKSQ